MKDRLIIAFNISKTYDLLMQGKGDRHSIYDCTRHYWRVSSKKAEQAELILGVAHGRVVGVYKPTSWRYVEYGNGRRIEFEGVEVADSAYMGVVTEYFHKSQNPVKYIGNW